MRFFKRLGVEITSFFEGDETGEEEISLRVLGIIFLLSLLLLFGLYFLVFVETKMVYNLPSNIFLHTRDGVVRLYDGIIDGVVRLYDRIIEGVVRLYDRIIEGVVRLYDRIIEGVVRLYDRIIEGVVRLYDRIIEGVVRLYDRIIDLIRSSAIGEIKTINNSYQMVSCEGCKINTRFESEQEKGLFVIDYQLSHKNWVWRQVHKIFERVFKTPVDFGWVQINKKLDYVDWSQHDTLILSAKGTGKPSNLEFAILEEDGDAWYYFDKNSLVSKDWIEIKMPFKEFTNPLWAGHGDGKKEFKNITRIEITITNFDESIKNTLNFEVFDGELFKLDS